MRGEIWRELTLVGHWISEAIILRWGELTHEISQKRVTVAEAVDKLLVVPETGRDQQRVREIYRNMADLRCVWTEDAIGLRGQFEVDHIIPFSLWHNNDLWNLMPTSKQVNSRKSNRIVSRAALRRSRDTIIHYWEVLRREGEPRFSTEVGRTLTRGDATWVTDWRPRAFSGLVEHVETLALQRGMERWSP